MSQWLRQGTSRVIGFGPFVSKSDGVTEPASAGIISAIDHATTGIKLKKNGGASAVRHASVTASTYDANGFFNVTLDTTDTDTLGTLLVIYSDATTVLPVYRVFQVVPSQVWDALFGASNLQVDAVKIGGTAQTGRDIGASVLVGDKTGFSLTSGERTAIANEVEAQIIDDTDSEKVLAAITDKIASVNPSLSGLTLGAIASQVRTELATELGRIDAAISTRLSASSYTAPLNLTAAVIGTAVWENATRTLTSGANITMPSNEDIEAIKAKTDQFTFTGSLVNSSTAGAGAIAWSYTLTSTVDSAPIADAEIEVFSDEAETFRIAVARTDQYGIARFMLEPGTIYIRPNKTGWTFGTDIETVEAP